jgi:hypothetical protein
MYLIYSVLLLSYFVHDVSPWFYATPVKHINCDTITTPLLDKYETTLLNNIMELHELIRDVDNKNITCATIYTNTDEIIVVDAEYDIEYEIGNLHKISTIP